MPQPPRALVFDVFGTVVDWHGSIAREIRDAGLAVDPGDFALAWRAGYAPAMNDVRLGRLPWTNIDGLHRRILDRLLAERGIALEESARTHLTRGWHRLDPWPDVVDGLRRLRAQRPVATLSNGNVSLLIDLARRGGYAWDAVFSAELFGHYKPDPETYLGAARLLGVAPAELTLVAAHPDDLRAAARCGLGTAYVRRPDEFGRGAGLPHERVDEFGWVVDGFDELADKLRG